jgi:hypothetical protein
MKTIAHLSIMLLATSLPLCAQKNLPSKEQKALPQKTYADAHLTQARALFDEGKIQESSLQIYKAVDRIHRHIITADSLPTKSIVKIPNDLEAFAEQVENGEIKKSSTLDHHFADASKVLAAYYGKVAATALANKKTEKAGQAFKRSAAHIENTAKWSGQELGEADKKTVTGLRNAGNSLLKAGGTVVKAPGKILKSSQTLLEKLSQNLKTTKKTK